MSTGKIENCVELFVRASLATPDRMALWFEDGARLSFSELASLTMRAQAEFSSRGVSKDVPVLLALPAGPELYAAILGLMGLGAPMVIVEPWMPLEKINHILRQVKPKAILSGWQGRLWGLKVPGVREIPHWVSPGQIRRESNASKQIRVEPREPESRVLVTFSSGTSGQPKGVVRTDHFMTEMHYLLTENESRDNFAGPDLAIFPNVALFRLGTGRGSVFVRAGWKPKTLAKIFALPEEIQPQTMSVGPAFLAKLIEAKRKLPGLDRLQNIYIGGALTECRWIEEGIRLWPNANWHHVYGGSDAEPISMGDARECLSQSRERGYFHMLNVGRPFSFVKTRFESDNLWVAGPNVCPEYIDAPEENRLVKKRDEQNVLWHSMGDRVASDQSGLWYLGRGTQARADFELEQKIYGILGHANAFLHRHPTRGTLLVGQEIDVKKLGSSLGIAQVVPAQIVRDRRHRARIDRASTLRKIRL